MEANWKTLALGAGALLAGLVVGRFTAPPPLPVQPPPPQATAPTGDLERRLAEQDLLIARLRAELDQRGAASPLPAEAATPIAFNNEDLQQAADTLMKNDAFQSILERGWQDGVTRMIDQQYSDLFRILGLDPPSAEALQALLVKKLTKDSSPQVPWLRDQAEVSDSEEEIDAEIQALLGQENYAAFQHYQDTREARQTVRWYQHAQVDSGAPLSNQQVDRLVDLFHAHQADPGIGEAGAPSPWVAALQGKPVDPQLTASLDEMENSYQTILNQAESFLDEAQVEGLEAHLNQQIRQREFQAELANQLVPRLQELRDQLPEPKTFDP